MPAKPAKPVVWIGSSLKDLRGLPSLVQDVFGFALYMAQQGGKHDAAKPLRGFGGGGVLEVIEDFDGDTFRAVYTVKFEGVVYVLHVFQKKSKSGVKTPQSDLDLIEKRFKLAQAMHKGKRDA